MCIYTEQINSLKKNLMTRAKFTHEVIDVRGNTCIVITDANQGQMSVTNDIENVVAEICRAEGIVADRSIIVYKDSEGTWDGWDSANNHFVSLGKDNHMHALNSYLKKLRTPAN